MATQKEGEACQSVIGTIFSAMLQRKSKEASECGRVPENDRDVLRDLLSSATGAGISYGAYDCQLQNRRSLGPLRNRETPGIGRSRSSKCLARWSEY